MFVRQKSHKMENNTTLWILGHKLKKHQTTGNFDMVVFETPAGVQGPPSHSHETYQETFLILEGEMEFMVNGKTSTCRAGESIDVPSGTLHTFNNTSDKACKWVNIHSPKGFYSFFERFGVPVEETNSLAKSVHPDLIQKVLAEAETYDMCIAVPS